MAQLNLTLTHEEALQVLIGERDAAMKFLMERVLNEYEKPAPLDAGFSYGLVALRQKPPV